MKKLLWLLLALFVSTRTLAQNAPLVPVVTMGITLPALNSPAAVEVLVTDPTLVLAPSGQVTIDFGDGTPVATFDLSNTQAATTHSYTTLGQFTIKASYAGDANFAPASKSLTTVSVPVEPAYVLHAYGDSITGGFPGAWPVNLAQTLGWPRMSYSNGGYKTLDEAPGIYKSVVDTTFGSTWLLGENDGSAVFNGGQVQFEHAVLAENAWLAIPEGPAKMRAQSSTVTQAGSWEPSEIFETTGLNSSTAGSSLTATVPGSTIYVGLTSLTTTDYAVNVLIDGVDMGQISPRSAYSGKVFNGEPYAARYVLAGSESTTHTVQVVCSNAGTSGCYVDWIGGNGLARPNAPPFVWTGVTYTTLQPDTVGLFPLIQSLVRDAEGQLESDGLAIRLADLAGHFSGPELPQCLSDGIHPAQCASDVFQTVWLSSMSYLATEAQRIDVPQVNATAGVPVTLPATATSGLPLTYKLVSGSGRIQGDQLIASQTGTVVIQADQPGNSTVLAAAPVQFSVNVPATVTQISSVTADVNPQIVGKNVTFTANVIPPNVDGVAKTGTVTFAEGSTVIGQTPLRGANSAAISATFASAGSHIVTAVYSGDENYLPSSASVTEQMIQTQTIAWSNPGALTYGSAPVALSATATSGLPVTFKLISGPATLSGSTMTITGAGTITLEADQPGNTLFAAAQPATAAFTVLPKPATVTAIAASKVYGSADPALTGTLAGFLPGDNITAIYSRVAGESVTGGPYTISATLNPASAVSNYNVTYATAPFTISKSSLTVTPGNASRAYGAANPGFSFAATGLLNNDTAAVITGTPVYSTTATAASPLGRYPITMNGLTAADYNVIFSSGTLTITPAPLTVTAGNASRVYGVANPVLGFTVSGFLNADTQSAVVSGAPALSTTATTASVAGQYPIAVSQGTLTAANYSFANFVSGTLTVSDYSLTANPGSVNIPAGQSATVSILLTPVQNYQGSVRMSCGPLPKYVSCTWSSPSLLADGSNTPVQGTLTISTNGAQVASASQREPGASTLPATLLWVPGLTSGLLLLLNRRRLVKSRRLYQAAILLALLAGLSGPIACGYSVLASRGTDVVTVTGSFPGAGALTHSIKLTINVQ